MLSGRGDGAWCAAQGGEEMHYARAVAPAALLAIAATGIMVACSGSGSGGSDGQGQVVQAQNPPGNNGTVKIQEAGSTTEVPDNDPHVGCTFEIEFRGFDEGNLSATWTLSAQPPSGNNEIRNGTVDIGEDPAGGANDLDATEIVTITAADLAGLTENAQQGFHLKLEVHADGSQGADTKFKVFWVQGCGADAGVDAGPDADAAVPDAEVPDAAVPDAAVPDAAVPDAAVPDAAPPTDAGPKMW